MAATQVMADQTTSPQALASRLRDYYTLTKPEVNLLILITTSAGYYLGSAGALKISGLVDTLIGTLLVASGTGTLNQFMERTYDAQMRRTAKRPLPSGRIGANQALLFGVLLSLAGGLYLFVLVNALAALIAIATLLSYLLVYTPLKRKTALCTLLGAVPGAMPTLIGWAGASGSVDRSAWFLYAILFLWQFPHFLAIALMYREDYDRAGYQMLPRFDIDGRFTRGEIVIFTASLVITTMLPAVGHKGPVLYPLGMAAAGVFFLYYVANLAISCSRAVATRVVHASVIYLPVILAVMLFGRS